MSTVPAIPESAPFSPKQRAWLNGFIAGLVSSGRLGGDSNGDAAAFPISPLTAPSLPGPDAESSLQPLEKKAASWKDVADDDPTQYAWHDSAMSLDDRMKAAEGKPLDLRMMAAMAQLNCGQCNYLCRTYAKALETGEETDLSKCVPGGKPTARMLNQLKQEAPVSATAGASDSSAAAPPNRPPEAAPVGAAGSRVVYSRQNPFPAPAVSVVKITEDGSAKDTRLISMSLAGSGLEYKVGDALGVFPKNAKDQVEALIRLFGHDGSEPVRTAEGVSTTFRGALTEHCDIKSASDAFLDAMIARASSKETKALLQKCRDDQPVEGLPPAPRLIDVVARFRDVRLSLVEIMKSLEGLKPRLYSIASSPVVDPNIVDLVVGVVQYELAGERRRGVASTFLANRMIAHEPVPVFIQPCHHFSLPRNPKTPIIMVGPGTGVAPFRAFLHERRATNAPGDNWLFFGDQHAATEFLLKSELEAMQASGLLTRLSTAFSRDQKERIYVQNRMWEEREMLWSWLQRGAHFYVCGDAAKMAGDVDRMLHEVVAAGGNLTKEAAADYIKDLRKSQRYQRDVY